MALIHLCKPAAGKYKAVVEETVMDAQGFTVETGIRCEIGWVDMDLGAWYW